MVQHSAAWCSVVQHGVMKCNTVRCSIMMRCSTVRCNMVMESTWRINWSSVPSPEFRSATSCVNFLEKISAIILSKKFMYIYYLSAQLLKNIRRIDQGFPTLGFVPGWHHILCPLLLACLLRFMFMFYLHFTIMLNVIANLKLILS